MRFSFIFLLFLNHFHVKMCVFVDFILVLLMFRETWISAFWTVIGPIDFDDFQVCDFPLLSCCFWMIFMFSGALTRCFFDSRWAFKVKVGSHESTSWRHDFGRSPRTKIMKFHDCNFPLFSLLILIVLVFWVVQNVCFCWFYISFTDVSCNLNFGILDGHRTYWFLWFSIGNTRLP